MLEITCPDVLWVMERIVKGDWNEQANVDWLRRHEDPWDNAMDYLFGGWRHPEEHKIMGMGHINGFNEASLSKMLLEAEFSKVMRVPDERNPEPARGAVLKLLAWKSPCIGVCKYGKPTEKDAERICRGCGRTSGEIKEWLAASKDRQEEIVRQANQRKEEMNVDRNSRYQERVTKSLYSWFA
jgi:predicted Fe-S protein YdhL (DUF1289 family)